MKRSQLSYLVTMHCINKSQFDCTFFTDVVRNLRDSSCTDLWHIQAFTQDHLPRQGWCLHFTYSCLRHTDSIHLLNSIFKSLTVFFVDSFSQTATGVIWKTCPTSTRLCSLTLDCGTWRDISSIWTYPVSLKKWRPTTNRCNYDLTYQN